MQSEEQSSRRTMQLRRVALWLRRELGDTLLCGAAIYLGVLSSTLAPAAALSLLPWETLRLAGLVISPLAALPLAALVFDTRAWMRWRSASRAPLGTRLLRAYSDGILWPRYFRRS